MIVRPKKFALTPAAVESVVTADGGDVAVVDDDDDAGVIKQVPLERVDFVAAE